MDFPVSGVQCPAWLPPAAAFLAALGCAPMGISGAFLLLPFQLSVLGFSGLAVTPTNLIFNTIATPGGVYRYAREGRMDWKLGWAIAAGSVPGMFVGAAVRVWWMADPAVLKAFIGLVLLVLGVRLLLRGAGAAPEAHGPGRCHIRCALLAFPVGVVGGIYGVGGGALLAPVAVALLRLPARSIAGPALFGTLATSVAGVAAFDLVQQVRPDWTLGILLGAGGLLGAYCGARLQNRFTERHLRWLLALVLTGLGLSYCVRFLAAATA